MVFDQAILNAVFFLSTTVVAAIQPPRWHVNHAHRRKRQAFGPQTDSPKGQDIHVVENTCSDINQQQTEYKAHNQRLPLIQRLRTRSLQVISSGNNKVTLHVILLGVGGTIYNQNTITPLLNLNIPLHQVLQLATALHCHAIKSSNKNKTQNTIQQRQSDNRGSGGGLLVERLASGGLGAGQIAWLTTCQILFHLCYFSFFRFLVGLWLV